MSAKRILTGAAVLMRGARRLQGRYPPEVLVDLQRGGGR
jgi:hypothetical protein